MTEQIIKDWIQSGRQGVAKEYYAGHLAFFYNPQV